MKKHNYTLNIDLKSYKSFTYRDFIIYHRGSIKFINSTFKSVDIIQQFINIITNNNESAETLLKSELSKTTGLFSLIMLHDDIIYMISDIIRSMPVFYGVHNSKFFISENLYEFQKKNGAFNIDNNTLEEFVSSGFVYSNGTVFKDIYGIQAAEIVKIKNGEANTTRYFRFKPVNSQDQLIDIESFSKEFDSVMINIFSRMIDNNPNVNRWVVPLSGGHDSRLIVNYLFKLGVKNVICFSYGTKNNEQSDLSKRVSASLGYAWFFVEYTEEKWQDLYSTAIFDNYINYAFNGVSVPHLQDFLAVYELKANNIITEGDIFVPGHTFDFTAGSNLQKADLNCINKKQAIKLVMSMHTRNKRISDAPISKIMQVYDDSTASPQQFQEYFNWQEKRSKFMVNSIRNYEFFGFDYQLPFWDRHLIDFCMKLSPHQRMGRQVFIESESHGILVKDLLSIPFFGKNDRKSKSIIETTLSLLLPVYIKNIILRLTRRKVQFNAGLNQIYALRDKSVKKILDPIVDFPKNTIQYFKTFLKRHPYQIDYHFLTALYALRKQFDLD